MRAKELLHTTGVLLSLTVCTPLFAQQEMNWQSGSFPAISLPAITTRGGTASGSASLTLILNGDVDLSADTSGDAEMRGPGGAALTTEYALSFDGNGATASGRANVDYTPYDSFLASPVRITHVLGDDDCQVTLHVRATHPSGAALNAGAYSATARLTVTWVGP